MHADAGLVAQEGHMVSIYPFVSPHLFYRWSRKYPINTPTGQALRQVVAVTRLTDWASVERPLCLADWQHLGRLQTVRFQLVVQRIQTLRERSESGQSPAAVCMGIAGEMVDVRPTPNV